MDESLIMEIWDTFREYIPDKNKDTAAAQYIDFVLGKDVETAVIEGLVGYDSYLDDAIKNVLVDEGHEEQDEDNYYEEDEDY